MEDLRLLRHAWHYIDLMSEGINPLNGEKAPAGDTIANEKIQRCFKYVAEVLERAGKAPEKKVVYKEKFSISPEQLSAVQLSEMPIGVNEIARRINETLDKEKVKCISGAKIASWITVQGYLKVVEGSDGKGRKTLNERSASLGLSSVEGVNTATGITYEKILYDINAQRYILDNVENIANS